ncbi:hypothetical protein [Actinomarinicola tropica]|uniref:Uncharacterized protein n=1 Tax=Actinomarinicola tropica TaxID=2789776 RepID=A0A5Q2RSJ6_9ACTN|nr:hypothetical protein [Actinomarinicola tropica]QGG96175.1 hypothetical protein GH723_14280 [Actinomarinicola tropica]
MTGVEVLVVEGGDLSPLRELLAALATAGSGWVNLTPADAEPPAPTSIWGRINGRGPDVPRITWTAPQHGRREEPAQLGIEHASGSKALPRLAEAGVGLPAGWVRLQDHAMRGIVAVPPPGTDPEAALRWGLAAVEHLAGWAADGRWRAEVHGVA